MHLSLPRRRAGWIICCLTKISTGSGCLWVPRGHGQINSGPHSSSLSPAGNSGRFESVIKGYSRTLCQSMEAGKRAPHTQTPPWSATGHVPAFHLATLPRVRRWSRWSRLYGVWVPGSCPTVSLAPVDHLTRLCDSVRPASSQVQGHPPHSSEGS